MSKWRKDLPDRNGSYLTVQSYMGTKVVDTAHFWRFPAKGDKPSSHKWTVDFSRWPERPHPQEIKVTHWMELPELPNEVSGGGAFPPSA